MRYKERGLGQNKSEPTFQMEEFKADNSLLSQVMSSNKPQTDVPGVSSLAKHEDQSNVTLSPEYRSMLEQEMVRRQGMSGMSGMPSRASDGSGSYIDNMIKVESGGDYNAHNKGSGAYGIGQFIPSTEKAYASKLGMTIPEARTKSGQMKLISAFTNDNRRGLIKAGFEPTQKNLYMAHNLGLGSALSALRGGSVKQKYLQGQGVSSIAEWNRKFAPRFA